MNKIGDVIYRQDAINAIENTECELTPAAWDEITDTINEVPSADIQPMRHGRWIDETFKPTGLVFHPYVCDQCGCHSESNFTYCPDCGAKMDEVE